MFTPKFASVISDHFYAELDRYKNENFNLFGKLLYINYSKNDELLTIGCCEYDAADRVDTGSYINLDDNDLILDFAINFSSFIQSLIPNNIFQILQNNAKFSLKEYEMLYWFIKKKKLIKIDIEFEFNYEYTSNNLTFKHEKDKFYIVLNNSSHINTKFVINPNIQLNFIEDYQILQVFKYYRLYHIFETLVRYINNDIEYGEYDNYDISLPTPNKMCDCVECSDEELNGMLKRNLSPLWLPRDNLTKNEFMRRIDSIPQNYNIEFTKDDEAYLCRNYYNFNTMNNLIKRYLMKDSNYFNPDYDWDDQICFENGLTYNEKLWNFYNYYILILKKNGRERINHVSTK